MDKIGEISVDPQGKGDKNHQNGEYPTRKQAALTGQNQPKEKSNNGQPSSFIDFLNQVNAINSHLYHHQHHLKIKIADKNQVLEIQLIETNDNTVVKNLTVKDVHEMAQNLPLEVINFINREV